MAKQTGIFHVVSLTSIQFWGENPGWFRGRKATLPCRVIKECCSSFTLGSTGHPYCLQTISLLHPYHKKKLKRTANRGWFGMVECRWGSRLVLWGLPFQKGGWLSYAVTCPSSERIKYDTLGGVRTTARNAEWGILKD